MAERDKHMEERSVLLVHIDHGDRTHDYVLYAVPRDREIEARVLADKAWNAYEALGRKPFYEEMLEKRFREAAMPFEALSFEPLEIRA